MFFKLFTGLIETIGTVIDLSPRGDILQLNISAPAIAGQLTEGNSVSVSGACCTVTLHNSETFYVELMEETLKRTKFVDMRRGAKVNLERAMRLDSRLDGHLVAGHVDGLAMVTKMGSGMTSKEISFSAPSEVISGIVSKGSVTIDGVSLTVIDCTQNSFSVGIIPTTLTATTIGSLQTSDKVNVETDMIGKYVMHFLESRFQDDKDGVKNSVTWDKLMQYGWV